jgi:hypothetical protein
MGDPEHAHESACDRESPATCAGVIDLKDWRRITRGDTFDDEREASMADKGSSPAKNGKTNGGGKGGGKK